MRWRRYVLLLLIGIVVGGPAPAGEPPTAPLLRLDTGMHGAIIMRIAVDRGGRWLATASDDKTLRLWDLKSGRLERVLRPPLGLGLEGKLFAVAMSPDGEWVATAGWTGGYWDRQYDIYVFRRASGEMVRRLSGLATVISDLAWSPDGRYLAAAPGARGGALRVYRTADFAPLGEDLDFADGSFGLDFDATGRLVATSRDGDLRLYRVSDAGLTRLVRRPAPGGKEPFAVRFSADGSRIAIGFIDSRQVAVVDAASLELRFFADATGVDNGSLGAVAWGPDGSLYAGGMYANGQGNPVRRWPDGGRGQPRDLPAAASTVMDLRPLPGGGVVFGAGGPAWGVLDAAGTRIRVVGGAAADLRGNHEGFRLSRDGRSVQFSYELGGRSPARFDAAARRLEAGANTALTPPTTVAPGLAVDGWRETRSPSLNGRPLPLQPFENAHSLALEPDGGGFVLGADWSLRRVDRDGQERWRRPVPDVPWSVNIAADGRLLVVAYGDGTIRWHRLADGNELLAFFPHADRRRWVLWTPGGYYDASPGAEELIGWHVNRGNDAAADFFPASRFRAQFYRPEVVARVLETLDEGRAIELANAERGRAAATPVAVANLLPPVVDLVGPADRTAVSSSPVTLRYRVRTPADAPLSGLRVRVNGQAVAVPEGRSLALAALSGVRELSVPIPAQDSEILVFAENKNGVSTPATLHVSWRGAAPAKDEFSVKPKLYVLAVGVSDYDKPELRLGFAAKDAQDFAAALGRQKGALYRDVEAKLLTDKAATRDEVVDGLDWLQRQVTAKDVGMLFLAGHGVNDANGIYYFLPANADADKLKRTGVAFSDIKNTLASLAGKALFFVDTCHSGNVMGGRRALPVDVDGLVNELTAAENGVVVFASSTGKQYSLEDPVWGNGAFTKALVEGITGKADLQRSGRITHKMLDFYVAERVKELTGGRQTPVNPSPQGVPDFPIAVVK